MGRSFPGARTSSTFGLLFILPNPGVVRLALPLALVLLAACAGRTAAPAADAGPAPRSTLPAITAEATSPGAEAEAARLLARARGALGADSLERALEQARRVVEEHPGAPGSSEGLWIIARAALAQGDAEVAAEATARLSGILPPDHPLVPALRVVRSDALSATGFWEEAAEGYLATPVDVPDSIRGRALEGLGRAVRELEFSALERLVDRQDGERWPRLTAPLAAEYALALHVRERTREAQLQARSALDLGAEGDVAELARSILAGEVTVRRRRAAVLGAILPRTGSPGEQQYAELIAEGIRARLEAVEGGTHLPVSLQVEDDSGSVEGIGRVVSSLEAREAVGIIGPLGESALRSAARARTTPIPLVSPTAPVDPEEFEAVYSLGAPDPGAAEALARFAAARDLRTAIVVHHGSAPFAYEADAFVREYEERGGRVVQRIDYPPGSTFFESALATVRDVLPDALVLPVPAGDIELLAPQITYFGLDTLGVRILGTDGWADPGVVQTVEPRHTDGVVLASPRLPGREAPGWESFVEQYETALQRTLRSRVPALGYDAAGLLLEAIATGAREPAEVIRAIEGIRRFPGATGSLSVRDGRVVRHYYLARLRDREMIPIDLGDE